MRQKHTLIIGLGDQHHGDDALSFLITSKIKERLPKKLKVVNGTGSCSSLVRLLKQADSAVVIDAVHTGAKPGTIFRLDAAHDPIPTDLFGSCKHDKGIHKALETLHACHKSPSHLVIYGIEAKKPEPGDHLSRTAKKAAEEVQELALHEFLGEV